jgi:glycosyltransferase involved in cell wall biosynthesis
MLRYRRHARGADLVHFQWLPVQPLDAHLLPRGRPLVLTAHDILPREPRPGQLRAQRRLYERFDAIVVHSQHGRARLLGELGVDPARVHVIAHGAFTHLAQGARSTGPPLSPPPGAGSPRPSAFGEEPAARLARASTGGGERTRVVLCFGLMRPYKGIELLLDAWGGVAGAAGLPPIADAELWIAGLPKMDISLLRARAPDNVRFDARFIDDRELARYFERAELVVLPYLQADQSGVLFTALAFGRPLLLSDVGGFPEFARDTGAARVVPAGDARALGAALRELLADRAALAGMCVKARAATEGRYSWRQVAAAHLRLYELLLA